jgi:hypothetical protein
VRTRRSNRTVQIALAAALAWAIVVLPYLASFLSDLLGYGDIDAWNQVFSDIPALGIFVLLPVVALVLSILLSVRLVYGDETPPDRSYAIALLGPGLAWVALLAFEFLA